jgi:hypothetical protein
MSKRWVLFLTILVVLALGTAGTVWAMGRPKKNTIVLEVSGTNGLAFKGTAEVDGTSRDLSGSVPAEFVLEGYRMKYTFTTTAVSGEFRVKAIRDGVTLGGAAGSGNPPKNGARGWVKSDWGWSPPRYWLEPFDMDGQPEWLSPPPWPTPLP